jgi:hypothetical protein
MKTRNQIVALAIGGLVIAAFGCSKQEEATSTAPAPMPKRETAANPAPPPASGAPAAAETAKDAAHDTAKAAQTATSDLAAKFQGIIDQVQKLISENKPTEALSLLDSLNGQQLTADQQSVVQKLKDQIQKPSQAASQATDEASKAVGGPVQPKK